MAVVLPLSKDNTRLRGWRNTKISAALVLGGIGVYWCQMGLHKGYNSLYHLRCLNNFKKSLLEMRAALQVRSRDFMNPLSLA
jgi:hypothetical protein